VHGVGVLINGPDETDEGANSDANIRLSTQIKKAETSSAFLSSCSEERIRTPDLRVMSPTSYLCSTSQCGCKCRLIFIAAKSLFQKSLSAFVYILSKTFIIKGFR
jgi:hypothetical protein